MSESPYIKDPENPTDAELAAAIQRGLADGSLIDAQEFLARERERTVVCGDCGDELQGLRSGRHADGTAQCMGRDDAGARHPYHFAWDTKEHAEKILARSGQPGTVVKDGLMWYVRALGACPQCGCNHNN